LDVTDPEVIRTILGICSNVHRLVLRIVQRRFERLNTIFLPLTDG